MKHKHEWHGINERWVADAILIAREHQLKRLKEIEEFGNLNGYITSEDVRYVGKCFIYF